jgi:hypothetical protein
MDQEKYLRLTRPNEYKYKENRRAFQYVETTIIDGSAVFKHRGSNIVFRRINEVIEQYLFEETEAAEINLNQKIKEYRREPV